MASLAAILKAELEFYPFLNFGFPPIGYQIINFNNFNTAGKNCVKYFQSIKIFKILKYLKTELKFYCFLNFGFPPIGYQIIN